METNLNGPLLNPIHIEFYGLTGCGKSTMSHYIADMLRTEGYQVHEPTYEMDHELIAIVRKIKKLIITIMFSIKYYNEFINICLLIKKTGHIKVKDFILQIVNIVPKYYIYKKSNNAIYIWDEGIIQSSVSVIMSSNSELSVSMIGDFIQMIDTRNRIIGVYLDYPIELAENRMYMRNTKESRADRLSGDDKTEFMCKFQYILNKAKKCDIHVSDHTVSNDKVLELILLHIDECKIKRC